MEQVTANLVVNGIRHGEGAEVDNVPGAYGAPVMVTVRDYGPDVAQGMQRIIFEQFEQVLAAKPSGARGVGLSLCREIAKRHEEYIGCVEPDGPGA